MMNRILATIALIVLVLSVPARAHASTEPVAAFADVVKRADISVGNAKHLLVPAPEIDEERSPWVVGLLTVGIVIFMIVLVVLPGRDGRDDESPRIGAYVKPRGRLPI